MAQTAQTVQVAQTAQTAQTDKDFDFKLIDRLFRISASGMDAPAFEMPATHWLQPNKAREALEAGGAMSRAIGLKLPVSYAGLSILNLMTAKLLVFVRYDRMLDLALDNLTFQMEERYGCMQTGYRIRDIRWADLPYDSDEQALFLEQDWRQYIRKHIDPAIRSIAHSAGLKPDLVWNQAGGRLAAIREYVNKQEEETDETFLERFDWHAGIIAGRMSPEDFARKRNPFVWIPRYTDNPWQPGGRMMIRSSCCMYDCREGGQKCYNCPQLTTEERDARRAAVLAEAET